MLHASQPAKVAEAVVWRAREVFHPVNGGVFPVAPDGKTVLRAKDSENVLTARNACRASRRKRITGGTWMSGLMTALN